MRVSAKKTALAAASLISRNRIRRGNFIKSRRSIVTGVLVFAAICLIYMPEGASLTNLLLGSGIVLFASVPMLQWLRQQQREDNIPFFQFFFFSHAVNFGFSVFQGRLAFRGIFGIPDEIVTETLLIVLVGMAALLAGWNLGRIFRLKLPFDYHLDERRFIRLLLVYLGFYSFFLVFQRFSIGDMLRAASGNLFEYMLGATGLVSIFYLSGYQAQNKLSKRQNQLFWGAVIVSLFSGLSSGWLSKCIAPIFALVLGRLSKGGHFSRRIVIVAAVLVLFLQVGKNAFRQMTWHGAMGGVVAESITDIPVLVSSWFSASAASLQRIDEQDRMGNAVLTTFRRFNHLEWFSWVVSQTPGSLPYLEGYSYNDLYLFLVPRFIWPDKPTNMDKANFIALRYGWIDPSQVGNQAVTPGLMDEAFINFGVSGVIIVMAAIGALFGVLSTALNNSKAGKGWQIALVALLCMKWLPIATAASYFGGFVQPIVIVLIMYLPARQKRTAG